MNKTCWLYMVLLLPGWVYAGVGDLSPATNSRSYLHRQEYKALGKEAFARPTPGDGTVHPKAWIVTATWKDRVIKVAVDASRPDAKDLNLFRVDLTGKGKFADAFVLKSRAKKAQSGSFGSRKPLVAKITLPSGRTVTALCRGNFYVKDPQYQLTLSIKAVLAGECAFGSKTYSVELIDANANGRFDDKAELVVTDGLAREFRYGDALMIHGAPGQVRNHTYGLGQFVRVGGRWYKVTVSQDATKIAAEEVELSTARLILPGKNWRAILLSERHLLRLSGKANFVEIPADKYVLLGYCNRSEDGRHEMLTFGERTDYALPVKIEHPRTLFDAPVGKTVAPALGAPFTVRLKVTEIPLSEKNQERTAKIELFAMDVTGGEVRKVLAPDGNKLPKPVIQIVDASGKEVYRSTMEYG